MFKNVHPSRRCFQIEVSRGYDKNSWHEDLRRFYLKPGAYAEDATFLFTDTQIVIEEFLEDINNTLNSGNPPSPKLHEFFVEATQIVD